MNERTERPPVVWKMPPVLWATGLLVAAMLLLIYFEGLERMVHKWSNSEEYGYGFLIPFISLFLIWQKTDVLERIPFHGSWTGLLIVLAGVFGFFLGELSTLYIIVQYSFLLCLIGVVVTLVGWKPLRYLAAPLALLIFMIPLPVFLYQGLSSQLQLVSSELGVAIIRLFGISVFLEGNVIDLGIYKLQVVEACSGLRYLFPLACLSFLAAYLFQGAFWKRALIFLSSIPIAIFMNSFRIGMIGILVEHGGIEQAEGFLHDFEGWVIFMACMVILIGEMWLLGKIGPDPRPLAELFSIEFPDSAPEGADFRSRAIPKPLVVSLFVLLLTSISTFGLEGRQEVVPARSDFSDFPMQLGEWTGRRDQLEQIFIDQLKFDDYVLMDYISPSDEYVSFYVAYYGSQRKGQSAHSPRSCLPGGGWRITSLAQKPIEGLSIHGVPLVVNRVVIKKGEFTQLVYYWFQQRGRVITNEYLVKWFLFWDALWSQRTDGALVRLTTLIPPDADLAAADESLTRFAGAMVDPLGEYIPN